MFAKLFKKDKKDKKEKDDTKKTDTQSNTSESKKDDAPKSAQEKLTKDDFESLDVLGKGSFAYVVLCRHIATNKYYAMKIVNKQGLLDHKRVQDVFTERNVLTRLNHPYLLKLHYTFQSEHKLFFVMDYMPGGDLDKYMNAAPNKQLDLFTAKLYGAEILLAILCLHEHSVIYRDLKPENILLAGDGHCALADFGLSKDFHKDGQDVSDKDLRANSFVGSPFYVAPDVLRQREYTAAVDFWSFGILLYRMLCGRTPFGGRSMKEVFDNILYSDLRFPSSVQLSPEAKDLISRLLIKEPNRRIKGNEVKAHPFWNGLSFDDVMQKKVVPPKWTPLPTVEEMIAEKKNGPSNKNTMQVVNTPAQSSSINDGQQQLFGGFSCTADSHLN
ncbi:serine/threonine-protein kinase [Angomonas deanei]|uniref:Protein kinase domain/Protein tyrosine kinase, putative n=1 Tax=Angomonas deanei TaxID=59799 RepID=A0A7G2CEN9_9TRYP|nr:serine/threonine-protein kinase [Angomonas deanei]CAD2217431.1 Protein kinase domain/Protein tyrosine kinase, putative [Angomonas deanei]|eukprot:EPY35939.1 serine/threonine-protein kinase [Angomonas deanei]